MAFVLVVMCMSFPDMAAAGCLHVVAILLFLFMTKQENEYSCNFSNQTQTHDSAKMSSGILFQLLKTYLQIQVNGK